MNKKLTIVLLSMSLICVSPPSYAFFDKIFDIMKDMIKTGGDVAKDMINTGGDVVNKGIDTGGDVAKNSFKLMSKLSDDIGKMGNRILKMADKIGDMADRIVKTEEMMAKLTAKLAGKDINFKYSQGFGETKKIGGGSGSSGVVINVENKNVSMSEGPVINIPGNPDNYVLYVSSSALFYEYGTVITEVNENNNFDQAWERSLKAIQDGKSTWKKKQEFNVSVAVKLDENGFTSALSNSIDFNINP